MRPVRDLRDRSLPITATVSVSAPDQVGSEYRDRLRVHHDRPRGPCGRPNPDRPARRRTDRSARERAPVRERASPFPNSSLTSSPRWFATAASSVRCRRGCRAPACGPSRRQSRPTGRSCRLVQQHGDRIGVHAGNHDVRPAISVQVPRAARYGCAGVGSRPSIRTAVFTTAQDRQVVAIVELPRRGRRSHRVHVPIASPADSARR